MAIKIFICNYNGHNNDFSFQTDLSITHSLKTNIKKSSLKAMALEFNGHLHKHRTFNAH